jgi:HD domain
MRKIGDIYKQYQTMPNLQEHQLRVAAVAMQICDGFDLPLDKNSLATACLLHDMGNIVKFRLGAFPEMIKDQNIEYWESVQKEYIEKYGNDDYEANMAIISEIGVSKKVYDIADAVGFHNWCSVDNDGSWEHKIASYADSRVSPFGVLSLDDRLMDASKRYKDVDHFTNDYKDTLYDCVRDFEKQIFEHLKFSPSDITNDSIEPYINNLKNFEF